MRTGGSLKVLACCLTVGCVVVATSDAHAHASPSTRRARTANLIQEIFERFFFKSWLGEAMSLAGSGACPEAQVLGALSQKDRFPETFLRHIPDPKILAKYCGVVAIEVERPGAFHFLLRAPR